MPNRLAVAIATFSALAATVTAAPITWVNGDFELGAVTWSPGPATTVVDADGDGDLEARTLGCSDWVVSRGVSKGVVPATTPLSLDVEDGALNFYSFRMILANVEDPEPYANNLLPDPDWFDDHVLAWEANVPVTGHLVLDPVAATAFNIPGWAGMSAVEREAELATYAHMTLVVYGCGWAGGAQGAATLDNFAWEI